MCVSCSVNGTEKMCPTCRQLNPIGFPYDANADLGTLWSHAFGAFQREIAMCLVAVLVFLALAMAGGVVGNIISAIINTILGFANENDPAKLLRNLGKFGAGIVVTQVVSMIVNMVVQGVALVGFNRFLMDILVGKKADISRMFSQLHLLPRFVAMQLILMVAITLPMFVFLGFVAALGLGLSGLEFNHLSEFRPEKLLNPAVVGLFFGSSVFLLAVSVVILPVTLFSGPELIVGQCGPLEALKRSWDLGEGQRLRIFGYSLVGGLIFLVGFVLCCVGTIPALPIVQLLWLSLFLALRRSSSLPEAIH